MLEGYVPVDITKTLAAFLDFCYIARRSALTKGSLDMLDTALQRFHHYQEIFRIPGIHLTSFSLPRQHLLKHYRHHIENFGAPNGLCSSITESKHITAVKKPWRRLSWYEALKQMLVINMQNEKLAAARVDFASRGMLHGMCLGEALQLWRQDCGIKADDPLDDEDESSGPDGNGQGGRDLDLNDKDNDNNTPPGPVDGPPVLSEVVLAPRRGTVHSPGLSDIFTDSLTQSQNTPPLHSRHSGSMSVK